MKIKKGVKLLLAGLVIILLCSCGTSNYEQRRREIEAERHTMTRGYGEYYPQSYDKQILRQQQREFTYRKMRRWEEERE